MDPSRASTRRTGTTPVPHCGTVRAAAGSLAVVVCLLLAGCGFQLQGRVPLAGDLQRVSVQAVDGQSDFLRAMRRSLMASGASLDPDAATVLSIERDEFLERVVSVSARNVPREYELTYLVRFSLRVGNESRVRSEELTVSRDFSFDEKIALAKDREREQLRATLAEEAAGIVLQRLASLR
jgi:LPS-assembly lipoprotein